ncbi:MAG: trypsin-like peptidase domain-containing protein [Oscillospiraceae bacterium]|jgi:serine protease Do|nr:trypsin-like peptidase domain-containing protein [Oscillospiraceae bacterium]
MFDDYKENEANEPENEASPNNKLDFADIFRREPPRRPQAPEAEPLSFPTAPLPTAQAAEDAAEKSEFSYVPTPSEDEQENSFYFSTGELKGEETVQLQIEEITSEDEPVIDLFTIESDSAAPITAPADGTKDFQEEFNTMRDELEPQPEEKAASYAAPAVASSVEAVNPPAPQPLRPPVNPVYVGPRPPQAFPQNIPNTYAQPPSQPPVQAGAPIPIYPVPQPPVRPAGQPYPYYQPRPQVYPVTPEDTSSGVPYPAAAPASAQEWESPRKSSKGLYIALGVLSFLVVLSLIFNVIFVVTGNIKTGSKTGTTESAPNAGKELPVNESPKTDTTLPSSGEALTSAQIAAKVRPSVVSVITYDASVLGQNGGMGSGIIYSDDGYIITNAHVIGNTKTMHVTVVTEDNKEYSAKVLGYDNVTDLAVLKIEASGLPVAEFGESEKLVPGDEVIAIGNPGGEQLAGSITRGIISGVDRVIDTDSSSASAMKYIQTDAAINPGNSGGALVNMYGQVVGINSAKIAATGYEGLGFAIPIATARPIIKDLSSYGYVQGRVKLGISCTEIGSSAAQYYRVPTGLLIRSIDSDSDLNGKAEVGDIIAKVNGKEISSLIEFQDAIVGKKEGDSIKLSLYRPNQRNGNGTNFDVTVKLIADKGETEAPQQQQYYQDDYGYGNW